MRDLYVHDLARLAIHEDALKENEVRERTSKEGHQRLLERERVANLMVTFGLDNVEASLLEHQGGAKTEYSIAWAHHAAELLGDDANVKLEALLNDKSHGDVSITRELKKLGLIPPERISDNGPVLRAILKTAVLALDYNKKTNGALFKKEVSEL